VQRLTLNKIIDGEYGKKVTTKMVQQQYDIHAKNYGARFEEYLKKTKQTPDSFKEAIRTQLVLREAIQDNAVFTKQQLTAQFKTYQPQVKVQVIMTGTMADAKKAIKEIDGGLSFDKAVREYSLDTSTSANKGILPKFDNYSTGIDTAVKAAGFKLKTGEMTKTPVTGKNGYYIIKMVDNPGKGTVESRKEILKAQLISDMLLGKNQAMTTAALKRVVQKADVQFTDNDLKQALAVYLN
jgi:foldase protein PrsA